MYQTKIYAHRGASEYAPENTMEAFKLAYHMKADGIELDVQMTADGYLVVAHDEAIDRVSNGHGLIKDMTLEELRAFNFNRTHMEYTECPIPLLEEVLEYFSKTSMLFNLELKNGVFPYKGLEEKTLALVKKYGMLDRTIFSSFNHASMRKLAVMEPDARTAFLSAEIQADVIGYLEENYTRIYHPAYCLLERAENIIEELHESGIIVNTWTVNAGSMIRKLCNLGVDGIITNKPDLGAEIRDDF